MVAKRQIIVTRIDHDQLRKRCFSKIVGAFGDEPYLKALRGELNIAQIVNPEEVPPDVVTMNSTVRLRDVRSNQTDTYTLVYPRHADIAEGNLSVLAPIGTAILGYRVGDLVQWRVPSGLVRFKIEELIFQPERDGIVA